jgi:hypothetical protein
MTLEATMIAPMVLQHTRGFTFSGAAISRVLTSGSDITWKKI